MGLRDRTPPTVEEYLADRERFKNWGRWGEDDELGTLNLITREVRRHASTLVRDGRAVSCSYPVATRPGPRNPMPAQHFVSFGPANSGDYIGLSFHGVVNTHIDALCHNYTGPGGEMYNGRPSSLVTSAGAAANSVDRMKEGIVTRGVLYDIPRLRGTGYVSLDSPIHGWDLEDAARAQGVEPRSGDAVLIRGSMEHFLAAHPEYDRMGAPMPGVHASCLEYLHEHDASLLGWDMLDASDQGYPGTIPTPSGTLASWPVHFMALPYMGMPLLDNAYLEPLAAACAEAGRYEFLFLTAPLIVPGGTGSPVNPIAVL
ncbi:MAG: cyclase family protein [Chloroflexi bacterium]|nr:cyclase family protein [Chloroflexota bacterium]